MLNPDKTDFVLFGSRPQLRRCVSDSLVISGSSVKRSSVVKHLGVLLDENLTMKAQVTKTCRNASLNLHKIAAIRPYLTAHTAQILIQGLVISHLDYCNICFIGLPDTELAKLQRFQNKAAKLIYKAGPRDSSSQCLKDLHWLPCRFRIQYKVLCLVYKALNDQAPVYLQSLFTKRQLRGRSHDSQDIQLVVPFTAKKTFADRSLRVYGPKLWNESITKEIRTSSTYSVH